MMPDMEKPIDRSLEEILEGNTIDAAQALIGWKLVRRLADGAILEALITETEAYAGPEDKASHAYNNRRTKRTDVMYRRAGTVYLYLLYGLHLCLNIVTEGLDYPSAVLIRGAYPLAGSEDLIAANRFSKRWADLSIDQRRNLLNGPGKICQGLSVSLDINGCLLGSCGLSIEPFLFPPVFAIEGLPRVGIGYAQEYRDKPWRFRLDPSLVPALP